MKTKTLAGFITMLVLFSSGSISAVPMGTTFSYQGKLSDGANPANGTYEFKFTLYDEATAGTVAGGPITNSPVGVTNGMFSVALDFGGAAFDGNARWLEIAVRTNGATADFTALAPRQLLRPSPYALYAPNAGVANNAATAVTATTAKGVADNIVTSAGIASGQVVKSLNGLKDDVALAAGANVTLTTNGNSLQISAGTNAGTSVLLGYKENGPFAAAPIASGNNAIALGEHAQALGNNSVVGGGLDNVASQWLTTVGGGWSNSAGGLLFGRTTIGGGEMNLATGDWSTVGGGQLNTAGGPLFGRATVAGGWQNTASGDMSTISGGSQNSALMGHAVIGGGQANVISNGAYASIGGGSQNLIVAGHGHIGGGQSNTISTLQAPWSAIGGGHVNQISGMAATIGGGYQNTVSSYGGAVGGGEANLAGGLDATVAGGHTNTASGYASAVGGGELNAGSNAHSTVGGGNRNQANGDAATVSGGNVNQANGDFATVAGGEQNLANGLGATVPGGINNRASGDYSFAAGQSALAHAQGSMVFADSQHGDFISMQPDEFAVRAAGGVRLQTGVGVHLNAANQPLIVRDWDPFASSAPNGKAGIGRWGLFMEPYALVLGIPNSDAGYRWMEVARYNPDGTREKVFGVGNDGVTTVKVLTITGGSDVAEPFEFSDAEPVPKGSVMVIDEAHPGRLRVSTQPYDTRVAGVVSGANGISPGIQMRQQGLLEGGRNVALTGRVYVQADTSNGAIQPGDLLTTSSTPGCAMRVSDHAKAQGAILGKAMTSLKEGRGLVLVLVSLQ